MFKARTVIFENELIEARIKRAAEENPRLRKMWDDGVVWWLCRNPRAGKRIPDLPIERYIYKLPSWGPGGLPSITVIYSVAEHEIIIEKSRIDFPSTPAK